MSTFTAVDAESLFDLLGRMDEKAEIIGGEIVPMTPTGPWPGFAADEVFVSLRDYVKRTGTGIACADGKVFRVQLPGRQSFSPDAAYFVGPQRAMKYYEGAPTFAVEVRSSGDYGPHAERLMAAKRADYFAAGTLVVWDVDLLSRDVVRVYRAEAPETPMICRPGEMADAEPAVPGWTMPVNDLLPEDWSYPAQGDLSN